MKSALLTTILTFLTQTAFALTGTCELKRVHPGGQDQGVKIMNTKKFTVGFAEEQIFESPDGVYELKVTTQGDDLLVLVHASNGALLMHSTINLTTQEQRAFPNPFSDGTILVVNCAEAKK